MGANEQSRSNNNHMFSQPSSTSLNLSGSEPLPKSLFHFVFRISGWHQLWVSVISVAVFLLNAAPIEIQRRVIDTAVKGGAVRDILLLVTAQAVIILSFGLLKLLMNLYRAWIGESATRALRVAIDTRLATRSAKSRQDGNDAVGLSMIMAESDDVGAFVGSSISIPIVEIGFLISVFSYLLILEPRMALVSAAILAPQIVIVPLIQRAINPRVAGRIVLLRKIGSDILTVSKYGRDNQNDDDLNIVFYVSMGIFALKFSMNFLMNLSYSVGGILILGLGGVLVVRGQTEIATVITFLSATGRVVDPWNDVVDWARNLAVSVVKYDLIVNGFARLDTEEDFASSR